MNRVRELCAAERIKLSTVPAFWWCCALALVLSVAPLAALALVTRTDGSRVSGLEFVDAAGALVLLLAALATTDDHRHRTGHLTALAEPRRAPALLAKVVVAAGASALLGLLAALAARGTARLMLPPDLLSASTPALWREVLGTVPVFAGHAAIGVAVGLLVRHAVATIAVLLTWYLVAEVAIGLLPGIGPRVYPWLPFANADHFRVGGTGGISGVAGLEMPMPLGAGGALAYFLAWAVGLLGVALLVEHRRC